MSKLNYDFTNLPKDYFLTKKKYLILMYVKNTRPIQRFIQIHYCVHIICNISILL